MPPKYQFGSKWYTVDGRLRETTPPISLSSDMNINWTYDHLPSLMNSGIYDKDNVKRMKDMIYENNNQRTAIGFLQKTMSGGKVDPQIYKTKYFLSEEDNDNAFTKYLKRFWSFSNIIGQVMTSLLGVWAIFKVIKFLIDTIIHGKILYDIYGVGWKLIASLWDSLTNYLTHNQNMKDRRGPTTPYIRSEDKDENQILYKRAEDTAEIMIPNDNSQRSDVAVQYNPNIYPRLVVQ